MKICSFDGCGRKQKSGGYCGGHYQQIWAGKELKPLIVKRVKRSSNLIAEQVASGVLMCLDCGRMLPLDCYGKCSQSKSGVKANCKECRKRQALDRRYGLSKKAWDELLNRQNGCCAICGTDNPPGVGFVVDHDHNCCPGKETCGNCIRSLLCTRCNATVGYIESHPDLVGALDYVQKNHVQLPEKYYESAAEFYGWLRAV